MELPTPEDLKHQREEEVDITQSELAERADVSQPLIARVEGGDVDPRLSTLRRIVEALEEAKGSVVRAGDVMNEDVASVSPDDSVPEALEKMEAEAYSQLPVLDGKYPVGSISHAGVIQAGESKSLDEQPVEAVMSEAFPNVAPDEPLSKAQAFLNYYKAVMVTEGGKAVGIITAVDVVSELS